MTGVPWRTGWRYRERGFRHIYWDAGTLLAQQWAWPSPPACAPAVHPLPGRRAGALVGADGVHEFPVAVLTFGAAGRSWSPAGRP